MKLYDMLDKEDWIELEKDINSKYGLNASVFDAEGNRITDFKKWANELCPAIKSNEKGQKYICSVAHQAIASEAMRTRKSVVEECDAGMVKIAVPIYVKDEFLGVTGGCGVLKESGAIEDYLIHKTIDINIEDIEKLAKGVKTIKKDKINSVVKYIEDRIDKIIDDFEN